MMRCEHCHTGHEKQNKHEPSSISLSLSFEDICPQWNNALITRFSNDSRLMDFEIVHIYAQNAGNIPRVLHIVYMEAEIMIIIQSQTIYYLNISKKIS
jgi:hypothetical protein